MAMAEERERMREKYRLVFGSAMGHEVLEDLRRHCGYDLDGFDRDAGQAAYNSGKRSVFLHIKRMTGRTEDA